MLFAVISLAIYDKLHLKKGNDKRNGEKAHAGKAIKPATNQSSPTALTMMVAPFGEQRFPLPSAVKGNVVWTAINDFGSETEQRKQSL